jgi:hypothetical protein
MLKFKHKYYFVLLLMIYLCFGSMVMAQDTLYAKLKYNQVSPNLSICTSLTSTDTKIEISVQIQNLEDDLVKVINYSYPITEDEKFKRSLRKDLAKNIILSSDSYLSSTNHHILKRDIRHHLRTVKKLMESNKSLKKQSVSRE